MIYRRTSTGQSAVSTQQFHYEIVIETFKIAKYRYLYYCVNYKTFISITSKTDLEEIMNKWMINTNTYALVFLLSNQLLNNVATVLNNELMDNKRYFYQYAAPSMINYTINLHPYITSSINYYDNLNVNNALQYFGSSFRNEILKQVEDFQDNYQDNVQYKYNPIMKYFTPTDIMDNVSAELVLMSYTRLNPNTIQINSMMASFLDNGRAGSYFQYELEYDFTGHGIYTDRYSELSVFPMQIAYGVFIKKLKAVLPMSTTSYLLREDPLSNSLIPTTTAGANSVYLEPDTKSGETKQLFASKVVNYSSQFNSTNWSAQQILGEPKVYPRYGDIAGSWTYAWPLTTRYQSITVQFDEPLYGEYVEIYETYNAGAIVSIDIIYTVDTITEKKNIYQQSEPTVIRKSQITRAEIPTLLYPMNMVEITIDPYPATNKGEVRTFVELDAIRLTGKTVTENTSTLIQEQKYYYFVDNTPLNLKSKLLVFNVCNDIDGTKMNDYVTELVNSYIPVIAIFRP